MHQEACSHSQLDAIHQHMMIVYTMTLLQQLFSWKGNTAAVHWSYLLANAAECSFWDLMCSHLTLRWL